MEIEFAVLTLDKLATRDLKSNEQLKKHSIDPSLDDKPIERAQHLLTVGEEVQRLSVIQSIPDLLCLNSAECMQKIVPKMQQLLPTGSTEYHMLASQTLRTVLQKKLINVDVFIETFLQPIIISMDNRDPTVANAWIETLMEIMDMLPVQVIQTQITPVALARSQMSKSVTVRLTSCRLLGNIAKRYDGPSLKKDLLPTITSLCQDVNPEVRGCMCLQLPNVAEQLGDDPTKSNLLPCIIELASDETSKVKEAALTTIVAILHVFSTDVLKNTLVPMLNQVIALSLKFDTGLLLTVTSLYGKLCLNIERALPAQEKETYLKWFSLLSQLGSRSKKNGKGNNYQSAVVADSYALCRQYCAYNLPAMANFCQTNVELLTKTLHPIFYELTVDTYYMVRKTIACGIHEVIRLYGKDSSLLRSDYMRLLKDESDDVLEGLIPNIAECFGLFLKFGVFSMNSLDQGLTDLVRSLIKCENVVAGTHNWRLHSTLLEQFECLHTIFNSDILFTNFVTLLFNRIQTCRAVPTRLAAMKALLVMLRYNSKAQQRSEIRNRIINDLCMSHNFYDRMLYIRSCNVIFEKFSTSYFKEFFFLKTVTLTEDRVANVRWATTCLLPKLRAMTKQPSDKKLLQLLEMTMERLANDPDPEVHRQLEASKKEFEKLDFNKTFPNDQRKCDEEKALLAVSDPKDQPVEKQTTSYPAYRNSGTTGATNAGAGAARRVGDRYVSPTTPRASNVAASSTSVPSSSSPRNTQFSKPPPSVQLSFTDPDREFLVDAGVRMPREVTVGGNTKVFREPAYARQNSLRGSKGAGKQAANVSSVISEESKESIGKTQLSRKGHASCNQQTSPTNKNVQSIPVPCTFHKNIRLPVQNRRTLISTHQKRHSLEVMDLNSNGENEALIKIEQTPFVGSGKSDNTNNNNNNNNSCIGRQLTTRGDRRQSHLPRPLSCINFPVKSLEGIKPANQHPMSRLPVSRTPDARCQRRT